MTTPKITQSELETNAQTYQEALDILADISQRLKYINERFPLESNGFDDELLRLQALLQGADHQSPRRELESLLQEAEILQYAVIDHR